MATNIEKYKEINHYCNTHNTQLIAVSKTKPISDLLEMYQLGQRDFGENYVQELVDKQPQLPVDIRWHYLGHLQSNKVKYIAPFVHLIHGVDSLKLLKEINKQAAKSNRVIDVLLQMHIAQEETKFGLDEPELDALIQDAELPQLSNICISGLMGMGSFSDDMELVKKEFKTLKHIFDNLQQYQTSNIKPHILSMGMSGDYQLAIEEGSTMVRIGSLLFGARS